MSRDTVERLILYFALGGLGALLAIRTCGAAERPELASRTSGVAPLAVFFDAQVDGEEFLEGRYAWDFGDPLSGLWEHSGLTKTEDSGPLAGHLYEQPGVYVATLNGTDTVTLTVEDPDVVFAGVSTRCFSQTGDFTGAPTGSMQVITSSLAVVASHLGPGRRLLLRRGEIWQQGGAQLGGTLDGPGLIGAFGPGDRPVIKITAQLFAPRWSDWRIQDLVIDGQWLSSSRAFRAAGPCSQVTIYHCAALSVKTGFTFSTSQLGGSGPLYDQCSIIESTVDWVIGGSGGYGSMFAGRRALMLGVRIFDAEMAEHVVRAPWLQGAVIAHCHLGLPAATKHALKIHGPPWEGTGLGNHEHTERVVISKNTFRGGLASWVVASAPEDSHTDQRVRTVLAQQNRVFAGAEMQTAFQVSCVDFLARNNLVDGTGGKATTGFSIARRGVEPMPSGVKILHNTVVTADPDRFAIASIGAGTLEALVSGNLGSAPASAQKVILLGSAVESYNLLHDSPGFADFPLDLSLMPGGPAVDFAPAIAEVWDDFPGELRGAVYDAGAYEVFEVGEGGG